MFLINKRFRFVITSLILSFGFVGIGFMDGRNRMFAILVLCLMTCLFFVWSLWEGLGFNTTILTLILPVLFTLGIGLFWFLLPSNLLAQLPVVVVYGIGLYALSSTMNIFNVSAIRNIALVRAAKGVGFVATLFVMFLLFDAILSLREEIYVVSVLVFCASFPLFLQGLWMSKLSLKLTSDLFSFSAVLSFGLASISAISYFWPVSVVVGSLFLTVGAYEFLGLAQVELEGRLFKQTVREYLIIGFLVFISMLLFTSWRG